MQITVFDSELCDSAFENLNNYNCSAPRRSERRLILFPYVAVEYILQAVDVNQCWKSV